MAFALLNKFEDGVVELPAAIVDYLGVNFGPVDTVLYAPNEASANYKREYRVTQVATHVLGSSDFKQATDHQGNIFISCRNKEDAKKMDKKMTFRLIKEIVRMNMEPTNICAILNEDQLFALGSLKGPERHVLCVWIEEEARHGSSWLCEYIPPLSILKCTDLLNKLWGWDRLLAYDLHDEFKDPSYMPMYESYLDKFYASNHYHNSAADAILQCLEKEKALSAKWKAKRVKVFPSNMDMSKDIENYMSNLVKDAENSRRPFIAYAAACITKEAELMLEWLSQDSFVPSEEYNICTEIRQLAFELAMLEGNWNTHHTAAVLLGMAKEARSLVENVSLGRLVSTDISLRIRTYGLNFLFRKLDEFESDAELTPGVRDEMTSATERNQITWGNTEGVSFGKKPCASKNLEYITDSEDEYPVLILRRPTAK